MSKVITFVELAAFLSSLGAWPYIKGSRYLRLFPLLLFVIVSVEILLTFFKKLIYFNAFIYNIQIPAQHLLYLLILFHAFISLRRKKVMVVFMIVLSAITVLTGLLLVRGNKINTLAYCTGSIFIIVGILMKFYEMLQNPQEFNFLKDPFFYMLFAFLLFNVGTLPYFTMGNWLYFTLKRTDILAVLINVMSIFNYVLYGTYTIAFTWMMLRKQSS